ncbi:MAG: putative peptidoglycan lipid flippase [Clostridiales bacterium]|nr:putative peptidoglycan lipid flippase [Clostridiales bacterium]
MFKAFILLFSGSMLGKLVGFLREILVATIFGTNTYISAYRVAQTATLIPVEMFLSNSLEAGFLPIYLRYIRNDKKMAQSFLGGIIMLFLLLSALVFAFIYWGASYWVSILAPGMDYQAKLLTSSMLKVTSVAVPLYILGALLARLEMAYNKYLLASLRSTIQSIGLVVGTLAAFYLKNAIFLAWGFVWAYMIYMLIAFLRLKKLNILKWPCDLSWKLIRETLVLFWHTIKHVLFVPMLIQTNIAVERIVASLISVSVIAAVDYAKFISEIGMVLLAVPLGMVGIVTFSVQDFSIVKQKLEQIMQLLLILVMPISLFIMYYHSDIIQVVYVRGAFDSVSAKITGQILFGISIGLWADILSYFLVKALYAQLRSKEVLIYTFVAVVMGILVKLLLYKRLGPLVLGLGVSVNAITRCIFVIHAFGLIRPFYLSFMKIALGSLPYILMCYFISHLFTNISQLLYLMLSIALFIIYWATYVLLNPQLRIHMSPLWEKVKGLIKR